MYNGIGLTTPRGSGTNGYIQTNKFFIKPRSSSASTAPYDADAAPAVGGVRKPNKDILEHDRKRRIELRLLSLREALADQGYTEDEVEEKLSETRKGLEEEAREKEKDKDGDCAAMPPPSKRFSDTQSHQIAARKQKQLEVFRSALGIKQGFESSDHEHQEESQQERTHNSENEKCDDVKAQDREKGSVSQNINRNGKQSLDKVRGREDFKDLKEHGGENKHGNNSTNDSMEDGEIRSSVRSIKEGSKHRKGNNKDDSDSDNYSGKENARKHGEKSVKKQKRHDSSSDYSTDDSNSGDSSNSDDSSDYSREKHGMKKAGIDSEKRMDISKGKQKFSSMTEKKNSKEVQTDHHRDGKIGRDHESWIDSSKMKQALGSSSRTERKNGKDVKINHHSDDYDKRSHLCYRHKTERTDSFEPQRDGDRDGCGSRKERKRKVEDAGIPDLSFRESRRPITDVELKARESREPGSYGRSQDCRREDYPNSNRYEDKHESRGRTKDDSSSTDDSNSGDSSNSDDNSDYSREKHGMKKAGVDSEKRMDISKGKQKFSSMTDKKNKKEVQTDHHRDGKIGRDHESLIDSSKMKQALGFSSRTERKNGEDVKTDQHSDDYDKRLHLGYRHKTERNDSFEPRRDGDKDGRGSREDRKRKLEDAGAPDHSFRESGRPITEVELKARESREPGSYGRSQDCRREDYPNSNRYEDKHESRGRTKDEQRYDDTKRRRRDDSPHYVPRDRHARNHEEDSADRYARNHEEDSGRGRRR